MWGRISYVEPTNNRVETFVNEDHLINVQSNEAILNPLEDYCIAVDLEVCIPDRKSCGFANENGEVTYMSFSSTKRTISFMNGTNGTLTTNFTDVSSLNPGDSTPECLGIENIDITFDSWLYPQVTIKFVDVRGAALMMPEETEYQQENHDGRPNKRDYIQSVYKALFSIPYPIFKLKVKGFYGLGATYYLCPEDTHIELDSTTGNFILTVKFIGHRFRVFADLPMSYICVAPFMTLGAPYWKEETTNPNGRFKFKNRDGTETPMKTFVEVRSAVADAIHSELQSKLVSNRIKTETESKKREDTLKDIKWSCPVINSSWLPDENGKYYSIVLGKSTKKDLAKTIKEYLRKVDSYDEKYAKEEKDKIGGNFSCLRPYTVEANIIEVTCDGDGKYSDADFMATNSSIKRTADNKIKELKGEKNKSNRKFSIVVLSTDTNGKKTLEDYINGGIEDVISSLVKKREADIKALKKEEEISIEKAIGFTPSIQNVYNLAFAHMDTFMHCFNACMHNIEEKMKSSYDPSRKLGTFINNNNVSADVDAQIIGDSIPPFPMFYKQAETTNPANGPKEQVWAGNLPSGIDLDEVQLVDDIIRASHTYYNENQKVDEKIEWYKQNSGNTSGATNEVQTDKNKENTKAAVTEPIESPITKIDKFIPLTTYDLANKTTLDNPYSYIKNRAYNGSTNGMVSIGLDILTTFMIRALYYFSTNEVANKVNSEKDRNSSAMKNEAKAFGDAEAVNFAKAISETFSSVEFRSFISDYSAKSGENVLRNIINSAKINLGEEKNKQIFGESNDMISYDVPAKRDKSTDTPNNLPIGDAAFSSFVGKVCSENDKNNSYFLPERESSAASPTHSTFFIKKDRNYIRDIYNNVRKVVNGFSDDEEKKYQLKSTKVAKEITNNMDDVLEKDNSNIIKSIVCKKNGRSMTWVDFRKKLVNNSLPDIMKEYMIQRPFRDGVFENGVFSGILYQNDGEALSYLLAIALNTVVPRSRVSNNVRDGWQSCGIQSESRNGIVLKSALLKEGAVYWRKEYMDTHNGEDPIKHNGFKGAAVDEMYCYTPSMTDTMDSSDIEDVTAIQGHFNDIVVGGVKENGAKSVPYIKWNPVKNLTASRKKALIDLFVEWSKNDVKDALMYLTLDELYTTTTTNKSKGYLSVACFNDKKRSEKNINAVDTSGNDFSIKQKEAASRLQDFLMTTYFDMYTVLDLYAGRVPMEGGDYSTCKFYAGRGTISAALNSFIKGLARIYKPEIDDEFVEAVKNEETRIIEQENNPFKNKDLRLATYQTLKSLYDKWLCAPFKGENTWKFFGPNARQSDNEANGSEFTNFVYIDSFYRKIGLNLLTNISNVTDWIGTCLPNIGNDSDNSAAAANSKSMHDFLCDMATDVGGILLSFPQSMAERNIMNVAKMFTPYSFNDDWQTDSSSFVFIYTYKPSEHLGTNQYPDDGFQITPEIATFIGDSNDNGYQIPAFGVTYGKQNQSIFKNITLTTQSSNVTEAAIYATMAIASKGSTGARESRFIGQDIYKVKTSYSYQCEFDMMGCSQIMPLMYFQLNNVPFWRGAYMVIKVQHRISQGDMVTHVTGVRINKYMLPWIEGELALADDYVPRSDTNEGAALGAVKFHDISSQGDHVGITDTAPNPEFVLPTTDDVWTFKEANVSETKPIISVWPAHGPNTDKSCEWAWSTQLVDDYIIPLLKVFDFADGTSFEDNIQRCNLNGAHTGKGYSSVQTRNLVSKYGSKQVISLVPHYNALDESKTQSNLKGKEGQYFVVFPGWYKYYGNKTKDADGNPKQQEQRRSDSTKFAFYAAREAWKMIDRKDEFDTMPENAIGALSNKDRNSNSFPVENGSVQVKTHWSSGKNSEYGDPAYVPNCACILTENWFRNYRPGNPTPDMPPSDKKTWDDNKDTYMEKDETTGRYKSMQAWLWSEQGSTAVGYLNAMAIVNYIASLSDKNSPTVNEKRLSELEKKKPYLVEKFRKWFADVNK